MKNMICRYSVHLIFLSTFLLTTDFVLGAGSTKKESKSSTKFKKPVLTENEKELFKTEFTKLNTVYEQLVTLEKYKDAIPIQKKMSELTEDIVGPNHPHTATMYLSLAELYLKVKPQEIGEAISSMWKVYKGRENLLGETHVDTISILKELGKLYLKSGKHLKALSFLKKAYKRHKDLLGPEHLDTIKTLFHLAKAVEHGHGRTQEDLEKAQSYFKKVLEVQKRELGEEDPSTLATLIEMGRAAIHQQDFQLMLDCSQKVYDARKKLLGETDTLTLEAKQLYAVALTAVGREEEAMDIYKVTRDSTSNDVTPDSDSDPEREGELINAITGQNLIHIQKGEFAKALKKSLSAYSIIGKEHPRSFQVLQEIVQHQREQSVKNHKEIIHYAQEFLQAVLKHLPSNDLMRFTAVESLARAYWDGGESEKFKNTFDRAVALSNKIFKDGDENVKMLSVLVMAATVKTDEKNWKEAFTLHEKAYKAAGKVPEKGEATLAVQIQSLQSMGYISSAQEKWAQAAEKYEKAYRMLKAVHGVKDKRVKRTLNEWVEAGHKTMEAQLEAGQIDEALKGVTKMLEIIKEVKDVGGNTPELEKTNQFLSSVSQQLKIETSGLFGKEEL